MSKLRSNKRWKMDKFTDDAGTVWDVHKAEKCAGTNCCIHNPSEHPLSNAPIILRTDPFKYAFAERICEHGIGHSDIDAVRYHASIGDHGLGIHGCDRCCTGNYEETQNGNSE